MKKLMIMGFALFLLSCEKAEINPESLKTEISADSAEAAKAGVTIAQYLEIKKILNSYGQQAIDNNSSVDVGSSF